MLLYNMAAGTILVVILLAVCTGNLLVNYQAALDKAHYLAYLPTKQDIFPNSSSEKCGRGITLSLHIG